MDKFIYQSYALNTTTERMANMTKTDYGANIYLNGLNCAQAVFSAFSEDYGIDAVTACKIASGLGGGARAGELCGVVSGAILVIGLKYGQQTAADAERKLMCNTETDEFIRRFRGQHEDLVCRNLKKSDTAPKQCKGLVVSAINILLDMDY